MTFTEFNLDRRVLAGVRDIGFEMPTPIQEQAIPLVRDGRDVMGLAQTGTGKTAAFMLPILHQLTTGPLRRVRALVLAPTRELAEQIAQASQEMGRHTRIRTISIYGGVGKKGQIDDLRRGAEIVIACPGRLLDLLGEGSIDLSQVEVLVLDEADRMCDMGFLPDVRRILRRLPTQRQTLFFSATMPDEIRDLSRDFLKDPATVQIGMIAPAKTVSHALYPVPQPTDKKALLWALLPQLSAGRMLIFTRTKHRARSLAKDLVRRGYRASALQGNMSQNQRQKAIDGFRSGKFDILAATDIAARGIDVSEITHVINFDMPDTVDAYTHRIGRTGRAEQDGTAFTFAALDDAPMVRDIEALLGEPLEKRRLSQFDYGDFDPEAQFQPVRRAPRSANSRPAAGSGSSRNGGSRNGSSSSNGSSRSGNGQSRRHRSRGRSSDRTDSRSRGAGAANPVDRERRRRD